MKKLWKIAQEEDEYGHETEALYFDDEQLARDWFESLGSKYLRSLEEINIIESSPIQIKTLTYSTRDNKFIEGEANLSEIESFIEANSETGIVLPSSQYYLRFTCLFSSAVSIGEVKKALFDTAKNELESIVKVDREKVDKLNLLWKTGTIERVINYTDFSHLEGDYDEVS